MKKNAIIVIFILCVLALITRTTSFAQLSKINAGPQITSPQAGAAVVPGQALAVTVTANPQAAGAATNLRVCILNQSNQGIVQVDVPNPQASNNVTLQIPANAPMGNYSLRAVFWPIENFDNGYVAKNITILWAAQ